jgi:hypothetical protein
LIRVAPVHASAGGQLKQKDRLEAPLFFDVVYEHNGSNVQALPAFSADGHLPLRILEKSVNEPIFASGAPGWLESCRSAVRTSKLDSIVLGVPVERRPSGEPDSHCFY